MSETENYGLHLTDDSSEKFKDWREAMNSSGNSNMEIIDSALGQMARVILSRTQPEDLNERDVWYKEVD